MNPTSCSNLLDILFTVVLPALALLCFIYISVLIRKKKGVEAIQQPLTALRRWRMVAVIVFVLCLPVYLLGHFVTDVSAYSGICGHSYGITTGEWIARPRSVKPDIENSPRKPYNTLTVQLQDRGGLPSTLFIERPGGSHFRTTHGFA